MTERKTTLSEPVAAAGLVVLASACAGFLFAQPRAVVPEELPSLVLPADEVRRVIERDRALAKRVPAGSQVDEVEKLLRADARAQAEFFEEHQRFQRRRRALRVACAGLARVGAEAVDALRARWVERLEDALALRLSPQEIPEVLGGFALTLERGGVTRDGAIVGPHFVVRTLYKAQWNASCGFPTDHGMERIERVAYHGWQAFHVDRLSPASKLAALEGYARAGGPHVEEARAIILLSAGQAGAAVPALEAAGREEGSIRLGNHLLAARQLAEAEN